MAKHTLKFGALYKKDYVSDYDATEFTTPLLLTCGTAATCNTAIGANVGNLLGQGLSLEAIQSFPLASHVPISLYSLGFYVQDDWKPLENLTLNMGVRVERNSNPYSSQQLFSPTSARISVSFVGTYGANIQCDGLQHDDQIGALQCLPQFPEGHGGTAVRLHFLSG